MFVSSGILTRPERAYSVNSIATSVNMGTFVYATRDGQELLLDLYLPTPTGGAAPVIMFLHGGGWTAGTRTTGPDFRRFFAQDGFAMASIEYRLAPAVTFPANVEDVKTAVRWLKAHAGPNRLDSSRIGLWGASAGGHLAAVAALSPPGTFEGTEHLDQSSGVRCVLDAYGASSFLSMDAETEMEKATLQRVPSTLGLPPHFPGGMPMHDDPMSFESQVVGAPIQTVPDRVRAASPLTYVTRHAPPFLLMHGLADHSVPHHQSVLLYEALVRAGNDATLRLIDGLPHAFFNKTNLDDLAGPFRMDVREHTSGGPEQRREERRGVFDVARSFFGKHLHH